MSLAEFQELKYWHQRQGRRHPVEKAIWDAVLTAWLLGWVGAPTAFLLHTGWGVVVCAVLWFLPGAYVAVRRGLHNRRWLRCDWIAALR